MKKRKRRTSKRVLSSIIAVILMVTMLGGTVFAESDTAGIVQASATESSEIGAGGVA